MLLVNKLLQYIQYIMVKYSTNKSECKRGQRDKWRKGKYLQIQQINRECFRNMRFWTIWFPTSSHFLVTHTLKVGWPSYISTKLEHSHQEINHYIKANIRTLWGQVALCRKVRTNLSNMDQFNWAQETVCNWVLLPGQTDLW